MSRYTVRHNVGGRPAGSAPVAVLADDHSGGWMPRVWLGAPAPGGLALPPASPTMAWMYSPRGVFIDDRHVVVADSGNHRVLIWHGVPQSDEQPADVVLGQPHGGSEGRAAGGRGPERGMNLPTGVAVIDGRLIVADAWHHRILIWDEVPTQSDVAPDVVLGQRDASSVEPNADGPCSAATLYWPFGFAMLGGRFWVADTGNRRVLGWLDGVPGPGQPADIVLGQPTAGGREENRGEAVGPASFRWPHAITGTAERMLVADAGDHRLLGWSPLPDADTPADSVLGQPDFASANEWPYGPHTGDRFRFPYAAALDGGRLAVADTANNRILIWDELPGEPRGGRPADHVLAQPDFGSNGENRWALVGRDTLCWPYGLCMHGDRLAVADSGNNRVMLWERDRR
ncbi:NHL repeat-containing protein [Mycobacterium sp. Y57]|uniref:NHL repeat-containing protein n=1 Tax=Mycolicibacterium xanthum TaxID=2796469 RepID=UPI001C84990B|nr:NHL repeat-containing protein [Mycolicibacterium xanthum]MBX7430928.1 NHL repeat-containing protein [Mycolicibacterium xanthum]